MSDYTFYFPYIYFTLLCHQLHIRTKSVLQKFNFPILMMNSYIFYLFIHFFSIQWIRFSLFLGKWILNLYFLWMYFLIYQEIISFLWNIHNQKSVLLYNLHWYFHEFTDYDLDSSCCVHWKEHLEYYHVVISCHLKDRDFDILLVKKFCFPLFIIP